MRPLLFATLAATLGAMPAAAHAGGETLPEPPRPAPKGLSVTATPLLGAESTAVDGWTGVVVRIDNARPEPIDGTVRVWSALPWAVGGKGIVSEAPVRLPAGGQARVPMVLRLHAAMASSLTVQLAEPGREPVNESVSGLSGSGPLLVEVSPVPRLAAALRGWPLLVSSWGAPLRGGASSTSLAVSSPPFDGKTGDPLLPERAATWAPATVVLLTSDTLARLPERSHRALARYVLAGGTLAVAVRRPEDLRGGPLPLLVGGAVQETAPPKELVEKPPAERPSEPLDEPPDAEEEEGPPAIPLA